jgi:hypothetical protein
VAALFFLIPSDQFSDEFTETSGLRTSAALRQSAGLNLGHGSYKYLAALRPGRFAIFIARTLETGH